MSEILDELWKSRHPYDALFLSIIEGYEIKVFPENSLDMYYIKGKEILIQYEGRTQDTYINYFLIWLIFEQTYKLDYEYNQEIMTRLVENHLDIYDSKVMPGYFNSTYYEKIKNKI